MTRTMWRTVVAAVAAVVVVAVLAAPSQAAPPYRGPVVMQNYSNLPNPNWYVAPGVRINQAAYNIRTLGNAYSSVPPWVYGYNPYPSVVNYGPVYPYYSTYPLRSYTTNPYLLYPYVPYYQGYPYYLYP